MRNAILVAAVVGMSACGGEIIEASKNSTPSGVECTSTGFGSVTFDGAFECNVMESAVTLAVHNFHRDHPTAVLPDLKNVNLNFHGVAGSHWASLPGYTVEVSATEEAAVEHLLGDLVLMLKSNQL
jgi:hypothetical protein